MKFIKQAIKIEINFALSRIRYNLLNRLTHQHYINRYKKIPRANTKQKVVVTLTTIPDRIGKIKVTLSSLLDQTYSPDVIYLAIPKISRITNEPYVIPDWLKYHPIINILYCDKDYGPASKLIPALLAERDNPDTKIIVVDDDRVYAKTLIESFCYWSDILSECAVCAGGIMFPTSEMPSCTYDKYKASEPSLASYLVAVDVLLGTDGFLVKPKFFDHSLTCYDSAPKSAFFEDDFWISGNLAKRKIKRYFIPCDRNVFLRGAYVSKDARDTRSLRLKENNDKKNADELYEYFADYW